MLKCLVVCCFLVAASLVFPAIAGERDEQALLEEVAGLEQKCRVVMDISAKALENALAEHYGAGTNILAALYRRDLGAASECVDGYRSSFTRTFKAAEAVMEVSKKAFEALAELELASGALKSGDIPDDDSAGKAVAAAERYMKSATAMLDEAGKGLEELKIRWLIPAKP